MQNSTNKSERERIIIANPIADFIRSRGHQLKRAGQNFVTSGCPVTVHKKYHRPVSVDVQRQLWHCNDCDEGGTVIEWLAREKGVSGADAIRELAGGRNDQKPRPKFVCAYDYTDERGKRLFQVCRTDPKDFFQRRPNGRGWINNTAGVRRVLYRLPEVIAAQSVIVTEGEKDADNLAKLSFVATTNCGGKKKWRDEYSETLRDKDVIVIGDTDEGGREHVALIIQSLTGIARSIKHVILPAEFKDVSDFIASMLPKLAKRAIATLIEAAPKIEAGNCVDVDVAPVPYTPPPLDLFPDHVQRFIRAGAATFDVDPAFFVSPILSGAAAMIGNARAIRLKEDYIEPPIIWSAHIASTGDGKSPGLQAATAPVQMRERELIRRNKEADQKFAEDFAKWDAKSKKDRARDEKPSKPPLLTCLMDDTTIEAVASRLNDNPRGVLLAKDEYSHWFESFDQYHDRAGADVSRWLSIWNGNFLAVDRVTGGRSYRIPDPRLSITGGVVPDKFKDLLTDDFFARGLPARFLFAMPSRNRPRKWVDKSIPKKIKADVNALFAKLAALQPGKNEHDEQSPVLLGLSAEAKKIFVDFYNECARRAYEADIREAAQWSKLSAYSARLALVGQLMRDQDAKEISGDVMRAACDLARWYGNEAERIYALIAETSEQRIERRLVEFIASRGGAVTVRDVTQSFRPLKNKREEAEQALVALIKKGRGQWKEVKPDGPGRPTRVFQMSPVSTSTKLSVFPRESPNSVDVDTSSVREIAPHEATN